jgi:hypothetical protein
MVSVRVPIWLSFTRMLLRPARDGPLEALRVRHEQVVADELDPAPRRSVRAAQPASRPRPRPSSRLTIG